MLKYVSFYSCRDLQDSLMDEAVKNDAQIRKGNYLANWRKLDRKAMKNVRQKCSKKNIFWL